MNIYRIKITMPDGSKGTYTGIFQDGFEAVVQTVSDYPEAKSVSAIFVMKGGAQ